MRSISARTSPMDRHSSGVGILYDYPMPRLPRYLVLLPAIAGALGAQTLIDNDQVRVLKVTDQPHQRHALHQHPFNRVMIYLNAGRQEIVTADGKRSEERRVGKECRSRWSPYH